VLAPADPGVLEAVEMRRIRHGWGLDGLGGPGVVRIAVDDCALLGHRGYVVTDRVTPAYVVDCCNADHASLASLGLVADVQPGYGLGYQQGTVVLWTH